MIYAYNDDKSKYDLSSVMKKTSHGISDTDVISGSSDVVREYQLIKTGVDTSGYTPIAILFERESYIKSISISHDTLNSKYYAKTVLNAGGSTIRDINLSLIVIWVKDDFVSSF